MSNALGVCQHINKKDSTMNLASKHLMMKQFEVRCRFLILAILIQGILCCEYEFHHSMEELKCSLQNRAVKLKCTASSSIHHDFNLHWHTDKSKNDLSSQVIHHYAEQGELILNKTSILTVLPWAIDGGNQCFWCELKLKDNNKELFRIRSTRVCTEWLSQTQQPCPGEIKMANITISNCDSLPAELVEKTRVLRETSNTTSTGDNITQTTMPEDPPITQPAATTASENTMALSTTIPTGEETTATNEEAMTANTLNVNTVTDMQDSIFASSEAIPTTSTDNSMITLPPSTATPPAPPRSFNDNDALSSSFTTLQSANNSTSPPASSVEGGLLAAIALCIVFIIAIIFLITFVIHLSRNKCRCCLRKKKSNLWRMENGNASRVQVQPISVVSQSRLHDVEPPTSPNDVDYDSLDGSTSPREQRPSLTTSERYVTTNPSPQHQRRVSAPPEVPPKPQRKTSAQPNLEPVSDAKPRVNSPPTYPPPRLHKNANGNVQEGHRSEVNTPVPPPVPKRTVSKEHLYHTLECSGSQGDYAQIDRDVVNSPSTSRVDSRAGSYGGSAAGSIAGSRAGSRPGSHHGSQVMRVGVSSDNVSQGRLEAGSPSFMAKKIKELFDDPRYAMVVVEKNIDEDDDDEELEVEEGLTGRREMSRSTPSLANTGLTGREGTDRRSLRLNHKVVASKGRLIYN